MMRINDFYPHEESHEGQNSAMLRSIKNHLYLFIDPPIPRVLILKTIFINGLWKPNVPNYTN